MMKNFVKAFLAFFLLAGPVLADEVWISSFSSVDESTRTLKIGRSVLHGIDVMGIGTASSIGIWDGNSTYTYIVKIASLTTTALIYFPLDVNITSGIVYQGFGTKPALVNFLYKSR